MGSQLARSGLTGIKRCIELLADKLGLCVIAKWRLDSLLLENRLRRILFEYEIDCVLDVGANVGQYRDFLRNRVGYQGLIISFEPDPENVARLKQVSAKDPKWIIQDFALGKENTVLNFHIMKSSVFNSFLEPDHSETLAYKEHNEIAKKIEVDVHRLDDIISRLKSEFDFRNVFLKLDTQGFDLDVFAGASGCLDLISGVQTEVSVLPIYKNMPTFDTSLQTFRASGFEVSGLYALSEERFPHAVEFDCIYLPKAS